MSEVVEGGAGLGGGGRSGLRGNTFGGRAGVQRVTKGIRKRCKSNPTSPRANVRAQIQKVPKGAER